jgi:hypothetical protein
MRAARWITLGLVFGLAVLRCGRTPGTAEKMSRDKEHTVIMSTAQPASLPHEPASTSELLSATHLFTVTLDSVKPTPWKLEADGLEHRRLSISAKLLQIFKGALAQPPGATFSVDLAQRRESEGSVSDYMGLWSHARPEPDVRVSYLLVSRAATGAPADAAALMQEGACKAVLPASRSADVTAAQQGERVYEEARREQRAAQRPEPEAAAARALLAFARQHAAALGEPFARYVWARVQPSVVGAKARPLDELLAAATAPGSGFALRFEIVAGLDRVVSALAGDPEVVRRIARAHAALLADDTVRQIHPRLVDVSLYNLIFAGDARRFPAREVFPDASERARLAKLLGAFSSDRARKLASWLSG